MIPSDFIAAGSGWGPLTLVHAYQIGILALVVGAVVRVVGHRSPHLAYALWMVVLVKCFVPPLAGISIDPMWALTPRSLVEALSTNHEGTAEIGAPERTAGAPRPASIDPAMAHGETGTTGHRPKLLSASNFGMTSTARTPLRDVRWPELLPVLWLFGAIFVFGVSIGRSTLWRRLLRRSSQSPSPHVAETAERVARRLRLRTPFRVGATTLNAGPVIVGLRSPTIYLPSNLCTQLKHRQLEAILAHELLHVRRRDAWIGAVQFLAQTLWWFHPLVWWMNGQIVRQRERCCDEEVIANLGGRRSDYAQSLVEILEARHRLEPVWGYPGVRPIELTKTRLEEIMTRPGMCHMRAPVWSWFAALLLALLTVPSGAMLVSADEKPTTSATQEPSTDGKAKSRRPPAMLKYGDGKADGKKSYGGSGMMIRFELPEGVSAIHGIRIHGSRYGYPQAPQEDFEITFLDESLEEILHSEAAPYHLFKRGKEQWVRVVFDKPVELPKSFWIALNFNAAQTKGVYISFDTSTGGEFSRVGLAGNETPPKETGTGGDWMIQAMLTRTGR